MGIFGFLNKSNMEEGLKQYHDSSNAVLLDVRTPEEFRQGHIPGSKNIPLQEIEKVQSIVGNKEIPVFVYCLSGARSRQAEMYLKRTGYQTVVNMGGISGYKGKVEK